MLYLYNLLHLNRRFFSHRQLYKYSIIPTLLMITPKKTQTNLLTNAGIHLIIESLRNSKFKKEEKSELIEVLSNAVQILVVVPK